jgi:hypothetical protein
VLPGVVGCALALGPGAGVVGAALELAGMDGFGFTLVDAELAVGAPVREAPGAALVLPVTVLPTPGLPLAEVELEPVPLGDVG